MPLLIRRLLLGPIICGIIASPDFAQDRIATVGSEKQITFQATGHILTNVGVWSRDSQWIVYDIRSDASGEQFDGRRIERVNVDSGEVQVLYEATNSASCGVVTYSPTDDCIVFIHGPEHPTPDWRYAAYHRRGTIVRSTTPGVTINLDARDLVPPFTAGALRGGSHVHTFSGDGNCVAFTYEDHVLQSADPTGHAEQNQRNVGVSVPIQAVRPPQRHPRNHDGSFFTVLVTRTEDHPRPGSDEISKAFSDAWIGNNGYRRTDGSHQRYAIAFQGHVSTADGDTISEVFVVDLPEDVTKPGSEGPLEGTTTLRPRPPMGTRQRRITYTNLRRHPGIQGARHWLRSSPDGSRIACLMRDDDGVVQLHTISPNGGELHQVTKNADDIGSAFTWSPDGKLIAHIVGQSVCVTRLATGQTIPIVGRHATASAPRPEACVVSPDGSKIAYVRRVVQGGVERNQIFVASIPTDIVR